MNVLSAPCLYHCTGLNTMLVSRSMYKKMDVFRPSSLKVIIIMDAARNLILHHIFSNTTKWRQLSIAYFRTPNNPAQKNSDLIREDIAIGDWIFTYFV
mmetsp:Transcript_7152/g.10885  ORF Transcript_7152/g.10885 Transcript_7152/m.10885 type:complete len:98 (+) Transcript_7152:109-402(+)